LLGRPSFGEAITNKAAQGRLSFEDRFTPPAQLIDPMGRWIATRALAE
jgi:hypothetical protein